MSIKSSYYEKIKSSTLWYFSSFGYFIAFALNTSEKHLFILSLVSLTIGTSKSKKKKEILSLINPYY